jgi:hypothetical protein
MKKYKYLKIDVSSLSAGLVHQTKNLNYILYYCYTHNLTPILPEFTFEKSHNNGIEIKDNFTKYYDFDTLTLAGAPFKVIYSDAGAPEDEILNIPKQHYKRQILKNNSVFENLETPEINLLYHKNIIETAKKVAQKLGKYTCVHVRRTDMLTNWQMIKDTSAKNILSKLAKQNERTVYIMTDEVDRSHFKRIIKNKNYDVFFWDSFEELKSISKNDNFLFYAIENAIMEMATYRIKTFNRSDIYSKSRILNDHYYQVDDTLTQEHFIYSKRNKWEYAFIRGMRKVKGFLRR